MTTSGAVANASLEQAEANMRVFLEAVTERADADAATRGETGAVDKPVRDAAGDSDGRYGWSVRINGVNVRILMPGADLDDVRSMGAESPCVFINGEPLGWASATVTAVPQP